MIGVVALIGDRDAGIEAVDQLVRKGDVVALALANRSGDRITERIAGSVDFGAQASAGAAKALGIRPPFCRRAPAACWCARTMVELIISHSRSASRASAARMPSRTPISIQR